MHPLAPKHFRTLRTFQPDTEYRGLNHYLHSYDSCSIIYPKTYSNPYTALPSLIVDPINPLKRNSTLIMKAPTVLVLQTLSPNPF